jgi:hypothetical protein
MLIRFRRFLDQRIVIDWLRMSLKEFRITPRKRSTLSCARCYAVVPVNQPNKGGQPSAEAGEGRAQTRENIAQSHMHPTQSGKRMSQGTGVRRHDDLGLSPSQDRRGRQALILASKSSDHETSVLARSALVGLGKAEPQ